MTREDFFNQVNSAFRGSDDDAPASGTPDHDLWVLTTNRKISEWARDNKNTWRSLFKLTKPVEPGTVTTAGTTTLTGASTYFTDYRVGDTILVSGETVRTIATITSDTSLTVTSAFSTSAASLTFTHKSIIAAGVQSYSMHRNLINPSDKVLITSTDDQDLPYQLVYPGDRGMTLKTAYLSGANPQILTFEETIASGSLPVGGELKVPGYYAPNPLTADSDIIPVDDPYWLVYTVASELAFNDLTYESKTADLIAKANNLWSQMVSNNRRGTNSNPRTLRTNVTRIPGSHT